MDEMLIVILWLMKLEQIRNAHQSETENPKYFHFEGRIDPAAASVALNVQSRPVVKPITQSSEIACSSSSPLRLRFPHVQISLIHSLFHTIK